MALVDADYKFIFVDVGSEGKVGDAGVFYKCALSSRLQYNQLNIPPPENIPGMQHPMPYVIVADDAFPLKTYLMKPFQRRNLSPTETIFNFRLSTARRVVENAFGLLSNRWRIFRSPMFLSPTKAKSVILACIVLHNMLRCNKLGESSQGTDTEFDQDDKEVSYNIGGAFHTLTPAPLPGRIPQDAREVRDRFANYFVSAGTVPYQYAKTGISENTVK